MTEKGMRDEDRTVKLAFTPGHLDEKIECPKCKGHMGVCITFTEYGELVRIEREVAELKAELRKYEPSDGVMFKLIALQQTIADAAELFETTKATRHHDQERIQAWLARPGVQATRKR